jgi:hypothetical protein
MKHLIVLLIFLLSPAIVSAVDFPNETQLQESGTYDYINNMSNISINVSIEDNSLLNDLLSWDNEVSAYENLVRVTSSPISYWASLVGYWIYVAFIVVTLIFVHGKLKSVEITGMVMMLMSLLVIIPSQADILLVPASVLALLYTFTGLGFGAILYGLFSGSD